LPSVVLLAPLPHLSPPYRKLATEEQTLNSVAVRFKLSKRSSARGLLDRHFQQTVGGPLSHCGKG
jgi:hypothetical protein